MDVNVFRTSVEFDEVFRINKNNMMRSSFILFSSQIASTKHTQ